MPITPRSGAPILPIPLVSPGFRGLNKQAEGAVLDPSWATEATNCVFDSAGRLACRKGYSDQTGSAISGSPTIRQLFELRKEDGTTQIVFSTSNNKLYKSASSPADITGTATVTVGNDWQFINFNNLVYGVQQGEQPIVYNGTTSFADVTASSGTAPTGNCGVAFSGRLWIVDSDKQTIKYSGLLDGNAWAASGAGSLDVTSVWPNGMDEITALAVFNGALLVFGRSCILFYSDGTGSELGIDPTNMYLYDTIVGTGCIARDTVKEVEGQDLLFLSSAGVQSLQRLIQEKSNPINNVSSNVRDYLTGFITSNTSSAIKAEYSPRDSCYILSFPTSLRAFCFDTRGRMDDGTYRVTEWASLAPTSMIASVSGALYLALDSVPGRVGLYSGYLDFGSTISLSYTSGWLDMSGTEQNLDSYLKILKTLSATVFSGTAVTVALKWDIDFEGSFSSATFVTGAGGSSEYGIAEYGIAEYSGGIALTRKSVPADGTGQYFRIGLQTSVNNSAFAIQQLAIYTKLGRLAT